jgi:hypothetical protein
MIHTLTALFTLSLFLGGSILKLNSGVLLGNITQYENYFGTISLVDGVRLGFIRHLPTDKGIVWEVGLVFHRKLCNSWVSTSIAFVLSQLKIL